MSRLLIHRDGPSAPSVMVTIDDSQHAGSGWLASQVESFGLSSEDWLSIFPSVSSLTYQCQFTQPPVSAASLGFKSLPEYAAFAMIPDLIQLGTAQVVATQDWLVPEEYSVVSTQRPWADMPEVDVIAKPSKRLTLVGTIVSVDDGRVHFADDLVDLAHDA